MSCQVDEQSQTETTVGFQDMRMLDPRQIVSEEPLKFGLRFPGGSYHLSEQPRARELVESE